MIQKQKSQVKQYLSESFKSSEWAGSFSSSVASNDSTGSANHLIPFSVLQHNESSVTSSKSTPTTPSSSKSATNYRLLNHINNRSNNSTYNSSASNNKGPSSGAISQSANEVINRSHSYEFSGKDGSTTGSTSSLPFLFRNGCYNSSVNASPSEQSGRAISPSISSVSASEVSFMKLSLINKYNTMQP